MPVALAPSFIFPTESTGAATTEAQDAYGAKSISALECPRPYRGGTAVPPAAGIISEPPSILAQLKSLSARIEALTQPADAETAEPVATESSVLPWQLRHYDSCASFVKRHPRSKPQGA